MDSQVINTREDSVAPKFAQLGRVGFRDKCAGFLGVRAITFQDKVWLMRPATDALLTRANQTG